MRRSVLMVLAVVLGALLFAAPPAQAAPDVEIPIASTGTYPFADTEFGAGTPDLIEVKAIGGACTFYLIDETPDPDVTWPVAQNPPWWSGSGVIGATYYTVAEDDVRPINLRGIGADHIYVDIGTASSVIVSLTKQR